MKNVFSVAVNAKDVEVLMHAVAVALQRWEAGDALMLGLDTVSAIPGEGVSQSALLRLPLESQIDSDAIIHSTRATLGPWIIRFQRLVRRLTWWFTEPILQQIRGFQRHAAQAIVSLARDQEALRSRLDELQADDRLAALEKELADLRARIASLEGRHEN